MSLRGHKRINIKKQSMGILKACVVITLHCKVFGLNVPKGLLVANVA